VTQHHRVAPWPQGTSLTSRKPNAHHNGTATRTNRRLGGRVARPGPTLYNAAGAYGSP
jgi:hypothetical protein